MEQLELKSFYEEIVDWLANSDIRTEEGAVYSWVNPKKPGYVYSEIIGYYIKLFAYLYKKTKNEKYLQRAIVSADYLSSHVSESGSVSRDATDYVFDSAICISGLIALNKITELKQELLGLVKEDMKTH